MNDPKIHENSVESEIIISSEERLQSLEGMSHAQAVEKRMKFNQGAFDLDEDDKNEEIVNRLSSRLED